MKDIKVTSTFDIKSMDRYINKDGSIDLNKKLDNMYISVVAECSDEFYDKLKSAAINDKRLDFITRDKCVIKHFRGRLENIEGWLSYMLKDLERFFKTASHSTQLDDEITMPKLCLTLEIDKLKNALFLFKQEQKELHWESYLRKRGERYDREKDSEFNNGYFAFLHPTIGYIGLVRNETDCLTFDMVVECSRSFSDTIKSIGHNCGLTVFKNPEAFAPEFNPPAPYTDRTLWIRTSIDALYKFTLFIRGYSYAIRDVIQWKESIALQSFVDLIKQSTSKYPCDLIPLESQSLSYADMSCIETAPIQYPLVMYRLDQMQTPSWEEDVAPDMIEVFYTDNGKTHLLINAPADFWRLFIQTVKYMNEHYVRNRCVLIKFYPESDIDVEMNISAKFQYERLVEVGGKAYIGVMLNDLKEIVKCPFHSDEKNNNKEWKHFAKTVEERPY